MTVTLNADMRVGGVQETITVTGETPVVDVQNSTRVQRVLDDEVVAALPASRGYGNLLATVSGIQANGIANSGIAPDMIFFTSRGGRSNEGTVQIDGMNVGSAFNGGGVAGYGYDTAERRRKCRSRWPAASARPTAAARSSTSCPRPAATPSAAPTSATSPASGRRATTSTTSCGRSASRTPPRSSGAGTPASRSAGRSSGTSVVLRHGADVRQLHRHRRPLRQRQRRQPDPLGLRRRSEHHAALGRQPEDRRRRASRGSSRRATRSARYFDYQKVCEGSSYAKDAEQCRVRGDDWIAVGGFGTWSPESTHSRDNSEQIMQFVVHLAGDQQAAARSGVLAVLQQLGRPDAGRRARPGAVHPGRRSGSLAGGVPGGQHAVPRLRRPGQQPPDAQRVARVAVLRHRRAQHEGGLPGGVRGDRHLRQLRDARAAVPLQRAACPTRSRSASRRGSRPTARATTRSTSRISGRATG